jgi:group I intron endonuclease
MKLNYKIPQAGVYKIVNIIDGKVYVGGTSNLYNRKYGHWGALRRGEHHSDRLQKAYNIYGKSAFSFEVIQTLGLESDIKKVEQKYIDEYKSYDSCYGYNIAPLSDSTKGVPCSEQKKILIGIANTGNKHTEECKKIISHFSTQHNLNASPETHKRWSEAQKRKWEGPAGMENRRRQSLLTIRITDEQIDEMIEMRKLGIPNKEICSKFDVSRKSFFYSNRFKGRIAEKERNVYVKA